LRTLVPERAAPPDMVDISHHHIHC
jgi:hypothetical protein